MPEGPLPRVISRRAFLLGGAFAVGVAFGEPASWPTPQSGNLGAWVHLSTDGTVTIQFALAEMGQGIMTTLPLILAEEMDADWARVRVVQSPCDGATYGIKGAIKTFGSTATLANYQRFRLIGAQIRQLLLLTAATTLQVRRSELQTESGRVLHAKSGRAIGYGVLASALRLPATLPAVTEADLKPSTSFKYLGKPLPRVDVPAKVTGAAIFGIDIRRPGMLYGAIVRPPVQGETALTHDDTAARAVPGIQKIIALPVGIGIIADSVEAARAAGNALKIGWSNNAKAKNYTSAQALSAYAADVNRNTTPAATYLKTGDAPAALIQAHTRLRATYTADHAAHLCMEPMNATALLEGDKIEIWAGTQAPTSVQAAVAKLAGLPIGDVTVHGTLLGGGFGRRFEVDYATDAFLLAKEMPGRPVKLIYSREDDVRKDPYRPLVAQSIEVGLDAAGGIAAWHQRIAGESYFARTAPAFLEKLAGKDPLVTGLGNIPYPVATQLMEYIRQDRGIAVGALRGTDAGYTVFATESMIDEIAAHLGQDPLAYRLELLKTTPRAQTVLREVATMCGWDRKRPKRGLGIAYSGDLGSFLAVAAEISLDAKTSAINVHTIWAAFDAGQIMQPINLEAQLEGGLVFGLGLALTEQLNIKNGAAVESNFSDYRVPRMSDIPEIEIRLIPTQNPPGGAGEAGIPAIAPAIANALAQLTGGKRIRALPMLPTRVKTALAT